MENPEITRIRCITDRYNRQQAFIEFLLKCSPCSVVEPTVPEPTFPILSLFLSVDGSNNPSTSQQESLFFNGNRFLTFAKEDGTPIKVRPAGAQGMSVELLDVNLLESIQVIDERGFSPSNHIDPIRFYDPKTGAPFSPFFQNIAIVQVTPNNTIYGNNFS